jgi:hypothetical protein
VSRREDRKSRRRAQPIEAERVAHRTAAARWPAEYTFLAQRVAGLALPPKGDSAYHIHAFLSVFINGRQIPIPTTWASTRQHRRRLRKARVVPAPDRPVATTSLPSMPFRQIEVGTSSA